VSLCAGFAPQNGIICLQQIGQEAIGKKMEKINEDGGMSEATREHLKKMETALSNIVDPAVREYLQLLKVTHEADNRFLCKSISQTRLYLGQKIRDLSDRLLGTKRE